MKLCVRNETQNSSDLEERINKIERKLDNSNIIVQNEKVQEKVKKEEIKVNNSLEKAKVEKVKTPTGKPVDNWVNVLDNLKKNGKLVLYTNLLNSKAVEVNDMTLGVQFAKPLTGFAKTVLESAENKKDLETAVSMACGKPMNIKYIVQNEETSKNENQANNPLDDLGIHINIIED